MTPLPLKKILDPLMLLLTYPATSDPLFFTRSFKYPLRKSIPHINWNRQCHVFSYLCYKYHPPPPVLNIWNMPVQLKIKCNPNSGFNFVFKWKMLCCVCYLSFFAFYVLFVICIIPISVIIVIFFLKKTLYPEKVLVTIHSLVIWQN